MKTKIKSSSVERVFKDLQNEILLAHFPYLNSRDALPCAPQEVGRINVILLRKHVPLAIKIDLFYLFFFNLNGYRKN